MILTENDREIYFPNLHLEGDALTGAIRRAQITAETLGSRRSLEVIQYFNLVVKVRSDNSFQLPYFPIQLTPAPEFQAKRSGFVGEFGRVYPTLSWNSITLSNIDLNLESGFGVIKTFDRFTELKANFYAGFDFSVSSTEVEFIKFSLANLLIWLESLPGKGVEEYRSAGVKYRPPQNEIPEYLLLPFRKYLPRSF